MPTSQRAGSPTLTPPSPSPPPGAAPASPGNHDIEAACEYETLDTAVRPPTHHARNAAHVFLFLCFLIINDGVTGLLGAYLARTVRDLASYCSAPLAARRAPLMRVRTGV